METARLKAFATSARTELIREVTARITAVLAQGSPERVERPSAVAGVEKAIADGGGGDQGKARVADKVAYTWFNRIIALRFMDANGYTGIGVVSPAADQVGQPEVLAAAKRGQIDKEVVSNDHNMAAIAGLLNGTRQPRPGVDAQAEAYSLLLAAYCQFWHKAMPFMFERQGDFTELLIPANLLAGDSALNRSVEVLTEDACKDVEVIGWLYQFYISERKDEVFAGFKRNKKAGVDEIPAATQLFTPDWIVRYLVENSVGRLWMLNHPDSSLVDRMDYYIAPVDEETDFLEIARPEELTVIDPACGSGHMLTYAFDLLYAIYEEEGYAPSEIPGLILTSNLYGTEIDPRAAALAAFALSMKATAKRKTFLKSAVEPRICVIEPVRFTPDEMDFLVTHDGDRHREEDFWNQFADADTFGSLIQPKPGLTERLSRYLETLDNDGDLFNEHIIKRARQAVGQAEYLAKSYSVVVANPPYMGTKGMNNKLSEFLSDELPDGKADLFAAFIDRNLGRVVHKGLIAMITMQSWMFLGSYERLRIRLTTDGDVLSMAHLGTAAFDSFGGEVVSTTAFVCSRTAKSLRGTFVRLVDVYPSSAKANQLRAVAATGSGYFLASASLFRQIPESPLAYWVTADEAALYAAGRLLDSVGSARKGIDTGENDRFVRFWFEVSHSKLRLDPTTAQRWVPYNKGGPNVRWYGNRYWVVDWEDNGKEIRARTTATSRKATIRNPDYFFREGFTYTTVSPGRFSARYTPPNAIFDSGGGTYFADANLFAYGALLNSAIAARHFEFLAPTVNYQPGDVSRVPVAPGIEAVPFQTDRLVELARDRWDASEISWDFGRPLVLDFACEGRLADCIGQVMRLEASAVAEIASIERRHNELLAPIYGVTDGSGGDELSALDTNTEPELVRDLVSYAVGCTLGRYSIDEPGLILADQGATMKDYFAKVPTSSFTLDEDNVIPIVDGDWFEDDIVGRFRHFLRVAFGEKHFEENLNFVIEHLGVRNLREYFITKNGKSKFYDDHVQRYKKRPIYWLFSSPKGSFNALVYLHRYTPSTASTVLTYLREYVTKLESSLQHAERAGNAKEADRLRKILVELNEYEHDTLYPKASENVVIDLDDGVKVNYRKLGGALRKIAGLESSGD